MNNFTLQFYDFLSTPQQRFMEHQNVYRINIVAKVFLIVGTLVSCQLLHFIEDLCGTLTIM